MKSGYGRRILGCAAALTAALLAGPGAPAGAADPPGTVRLATGHTDIVDPVTLESVVGAKVVFTLGSSTSPYAVPSAGGSSTRISTQYFWSAGGNFVWSGLDHRSWTDPATGESGPVNDKWEIPSDVGGVYATPSGTDAKIYDQDARTSAITLLGTVPGPQVSLEPGPLGVLISSHDADHHLNYIPYTNPAVVAVQTPPGNPVDCRNVTAAAAGCLQDAGTQHPKVVRVSLTGGAPVVTPADNLADEAGVYPVVTDTVTAWVSAGGTLVTVPAAGGAQTAFPTFTVHTDSLTADDAKVYAVRSGALGVDGIYAFTAAGTAPTRVTTSPSFPIQATHASLSAGRVVWFDDSVPGSSIRQRAVTRTSHGLTVGAMSTVTGVFLPGDNHVTFSDIGAAATSGMRVVWSLTADETDGTPTIVRISDGHTTRQLTTSALTLPKLSGLRVLWTDIHRHVIVYDLRHHAAFDATVAYGAKSADIWGDYLAFARADGSVWRKHLGHSSPLRLVHGAVAGTSTKVVTWGNRVAWSVRKTAGRYVSGMRNVLTNSPVIALASYRHVLTAGRAGLVTTDANHANKLRPWNGATARALPTSTQIAIDGGVVAWTATDGLPRVAPLPSYVLNPPRVLSDAAAATTLKSGATWHFHLVVTAPLTACTVRITNSSGAVVRDLPCAASAAKLGEAVVAWDGKSAGGRRVAPGTFTWRLVARNSDGGLEDGHGSSTPVRGTVTVR